MSPQHDIPDPVLFDAMMKLVETSRDFRVDVLTEMSELRKENQSLRKLLDSVVVEQHATQRQLHDMRIQMWLAFAPVAILVLLLLVSTIIQSIR